MRPEETRSDRDLSINVFIENVKPEKRFLFDIDEQANISIPYDITSIMQDPGDYFAQGTGLTMVSIANGQTIAPGDRPNTRDYEAVNNAYRCDPSTTSPTTNCLQAPVSSDYDHSSYNFKVDQVTVEFAKSQGWHYIGLRQHCKSNLNDQDTDDWGFADILDTSGPDVTYSITTDRCKKTHDRHVKYYQLYLCSSKKEESCAYSCDQRGICPVQSPDSTVGVETKSVSFTDNWMWICHYHM